MSNETIKTRSQVDVAYQWDLGSLFEDDVAFEQAFEELQSQIPALSDYQGKLGQSAQSLLEAIESILAVGRRLSNVYNYSTLKYDQDQTNADYQAMRSRTKQLYVQYKEATAFFEPELLSMSHDQLETFMQEDADLAKYRLYLDNLYREKDHVLSPDQEQLLAQAGEIFSTPSSVFGLMNNADFKFPSIEDHQGQLIQITHGNYSSLLESPNRQVRQAAFDGLYSVYDQFQNTLATTLAGQIKVHNYEAKVRGYESARQSSLANNNIPESVYDALIESVNQHLEYLHDYVAVRQQLLGLDQVEMYDMYTPILGEAPISFSYEEAKAVTLKALAPLGEEYIAIIQQAFDEAWIDVYENVGKRSGAYSSGTYDSKPYILMNWQDSLNSLYTLVHELGHSAHSYLTHANQDYVYGSYSIFLAEIASTFNENLLTHYLLEAYGDNLELKLYVLNQFLDGMKGTIYRQTQFAEFEHFMHVEDAKGTPLTASFLSNNYQELNARYYGPAANSDSHIRYEWSRIPHFYYNYYVFQYATGMSAATYFSSKVLAGDKQALDNYLGFLKSGSSKYPIDTMKEAGLDMTQADYINQALAVFKQRLDEFKELI